VEQVRIKRGTDQKVHFAIFDDALNRRPVDLSVFYDIVFEVFNTGDCDPILRKSIGTNGISFRQGRSTNEITVFVSADDTMRFRANSSLSQELRTYRLTGIKTNGERSVINEGIFYSEPTLGETNALCVD